MLYITDSDTINIRFAVALYASVGILRLLIDKTPFFTRNLKVFLMLSLSYPDLLSVGSQSIKCCLDNLIKWPLLIRYMHPITIIATCLHRPNKYMQ